MRFSLIIFSMVAFMFLCSTSVLAANSSGDRSGEPQKSPFNLELRNAILNYSSAFRQSAKYGEEYIPAEYTFIILFYYALIALGSVFIIIIMYGGFRWMTAGGNEDMVGEAKKTLVSAAIGLFIILGAYSIVFILLDLSTQIILEKESLPKGYPDNYSDGDVRDDY